MLKPEYISFHQTVIKGGETANSSFDIKCKINFDDINYRVKLPTGSVLRGTYTFTEKKDNKLVFKTDTDCVLAVSDDQIIFNLYPTHNAFYAFYLPNYVEPTFGESVAAEVESEQKFIEEFYGKRIAELALQRRIEIGLSYTEVLKILGYNDKKTTMEQVTDSLEIATVYYADYFIVFKNALVDYFIKY